MNYAVVTTKIDPQTKRQAMQTADDLGLPLSVVIKAFLKEFINTRSITFCASQEPSDYLKAVIKKAEENYRKGTISPAFSKARDAIKYLEDQGI
ncbi:type II toxin-antitoxin system RelB/DinJ family antitoxin [Candidatus Microgenomates bacterium]|nr:type II toxin-antitoxin system RelB/DinJ family antitoxin [Candidatus Microgenomates bacterium]